jgi:signal transduction histidine kinase
VIGWMIVVRDITEEHEIEQAREAITETVVHDLRSPMSAIVGALEMLSECLNEAEDPVIQQALLVAQRSANRVLALTEALLDIARLQSGRMEIASDTINLSKLVSELLAEFTALANDDSVIIRSEIPALLPILRADRDKLIRVLTNLVDNAIKFSSHGDAITISAESTAENQVTIKVKDSGPGIPPDYREKIFERFVQVPGLRGRRRGTGLGLAFCRLAVEAHGGRIWVESPPEGGSIFTFTLPVDPNSEENTP